MANVKSFTGYNKAPPEAMDALQDGLEDTLTFYSYPKAFAFHPL